MSKIMLIPYGCNYQIGYKDRLSVLGITDDPYKYNIAKDFPSEFIDEVNETIGADDQNSRLSKGYNLTLALISDGMVIASTSPYIDEVNNRFSAYYNSVYSIRGVCKAYGYDQAPVTQMYKRSYTELAVRLVERYIDIFAKRSTFKNKAMLKNATTLREKILILNTLFGKKILSSLHFTDSSRADMYMDMVLDFALIKGVKDGNYVYTAWDAVRDDLYLQPYVMGRSNSIDYLSDYVCAILNDIVCGLVEYKDKFGNIDHNIVSFDAGKVFYDIEKKCSFREL